MRSSIDVHHHHGTPRFAEFVSRPSDRAMPHNIWQVDAKENLRLADSSEACYLTITDEHSGAGLEGLVFPPEAHLPGTP